MAWIALRPDGEVYSILTKYFSEADIQAVFTTGTKAYQLYQKLCFSNTEMAARPLPSTSPANCRLSIEQLVDAYRPILSSLASRPGLIAGEER